MNQPETVRLIRRPTLPRLPGAYVSTPRVYERLDQWAAVTVVLGVQGYGKTTAVAAWLERQPPSVGSIWLTTRASSECVEGESDEAPELLGIIESAVADLESDGRLVIVIDDAHLLRDETLLHALVDAVAHHPRLHLVLCSRGSHPIELIAASRVDTALVPARRLLFTPAQIHELATAMGLDVSPAQAADLVRHFGGWPAAVRLVLDDLLDNDSAPSQLPLSRAERYLREVVMPAVNDRRILGEVVRFCLADRLTYRLIRDLSGGDDPDAAIRVLEAPGLAERRYEPDDVVLVYPSYIQNALREIYTQDDQAKARAAHRELARWYASHDGPGHTMSALHHSVEGKDTAVVAEIWTANSLALCRDHPAQVADALARIPRADVEKRPGMKVALATFTALGPPQAGSERAEPHLNLRQIRRLQGYVEASRRITRSELDRASLHDLLSVGIGLMIGLRLDGELAKSAAFGDAIEQRARTMLSAGADPGDQLPSLYFQRGLCQTLLGNNLAAIHEYQRAWELRVPTGPHIPAQAAGALAFTFALIGDSHMAGLWLERQRLAIPSSQDESHAEPYAVLARGILALDRLDGEATAAEIAFLDRNPLVDQTHLEWLRAQYELHYGDAPGAIAALDARGDREVQSNGDSTLLLTRSRSDLLLAAGEAQQCLAVLTKHHAEKVSILAVPLVHLHLLAGQPVEACRIAANVLLDEGLDSRCRMELLLLKALASLRMEDSTTAAQATRSALAIHRMTGLLRPFTYLEEADLDALLLVAQQPLNEATRNQLANQRRPYPPTLQLVRLTAREHDLARALARTDSRQQMADRLFVSRNTVKTQLATLYRKLNVNTREEALARLAVLGLHPDAADT